MGAEHEGKNAAVTRRDGGEPVFGKADSAQPCDSCDALAERLLKQPCWIIDILPEQVPANAGGQYAAVERYYLQPQRIAALYCKYAQILLRLNCYYDMTVSFDAGTRWENNPDPERFVQRMKNAPQNAFLRAVFASQGAMIDLDFGDTYLTLYDPQSALLEMVRSLAAAEGFFLWRPAE